MYNDSEIKKRLLAASMHLFSIVFTFVLPLIVLLVVKNSSKYFSFHAKEGLNLHFTFFPVLITLALVMNVVDFSLQYLYYILIGTEGILILIAFVSALCGRRFQYPVIRYFKTNEVN